MVTTLCTSGAAVLKAGANVNARFLSGATTEEDWTSFINQAEGYLSVLTREDLVTNYSTYDSIIKLILEEAASNIAAVYAINYDMSGYTDRLEAEDKINILLERIRLIIEELKDQKGTGFVINSS